MFIENDLALGGPDYILASMIPTTSLALSLWRFCELIGGFSKCLIHRSGAIDLAV